MIVFVDPKQSYVEIIQNIGRICRKQNKLSTVLIPSHVDVNKYKDCITEEDTDKIIRQEMSKTGDFNGILNVLSALRQSDPYLFELCLKYPETYTKKEIEQNLKNNGLKLDDKEYTPAELFDKYKVKYNQHKTETENFTKLSKVIKKNIQITNDKVLEEDIFIEYTDNSTDIKTEYIVKIDDKYQTTISNKDTVKKISKPNRNIKPIIHTNDDIKVLWKITSDINSDKKMFGGYIEATVKPGTEEYWFEMLNNVKLYIDKNNMRPPQKDKNPQIKTMGVWISAHIQNYKKNIGMMKIKKIKKYWEKFINDYRQYFLSNVEVWESKLNEVKSYIDQNKKRPSNSDKDSNIKILARWIRTQQKNYQKKKYIMENQEIYYKFTEFITSEIYSKYFLSNNDAWEAKLNEIKEYINQNNKRPSNSDKDIKIKSIAQWIAIQQINYKKKEQIMKNQNIYDKWGNFIKCDKYNKYFITNENIWYAKFNELKLYLNKHKKRPLQNHKDIKIKILAQWISDQQKNYKKKIRIMENQEIYDKFTELITCDTYSKYFITNEEAWSVKLTEVKLYINKNRKRPGQTDKDPNIKILGIWISQQIQNYKNKKNIMENQEMYDKWTDFITTETYSKYFTTETPAPKSTTIKPKLIETPIAKTDKTRTLSKYQELTKKMSIQKSQTTQKMFSDEPNLWEEYHKARDFSFKGYDKQEEIPVNKIISKLETKEKYKLKILDLGCGRNLIQQYFKDNNNFNITGYDYVENNGSKIADISHLPEENDIIDICIYSQSLMGSNWKDYLVEGKRILRYNGEMIISESSERFDIVKEYLETDLEMNIINADYNESQRWFYINAIKQ